MLLLQFLITPLTVFMGVIVAELITRSTRNEGEVQ